MKKINLFPIISALLLGFAYTSCTLFGLPLQEEYPYEYSSKDPKIYMTAYGFVESRQNLDMSRMFEAITLTGLKEEYEKPNRTFIIINNSGFTTYLNNKGLVTLADQNVDVLRNYLLSTIANGQYTSIDLPTVPLEMDILFKNDTTKLFLNRRPVGLTDANKYQVRVNDFPGTLRTFTVRTSNIEATNGIIHVVDNYPEYRVTKLP